ncbi:putative kinesin [Trypanosoma rangeli]|uniref:Putative kinesin n=1 Tax=Trypanosoma rangeli TaxID=5698 RepID=A0A3R7L3H0_TRYRA|nr:putative kinesin [Trypanosoma rangeli]RNF06822.1 putative kinesin [Trypanosoma rangeli]|eukprot:RNF06822.1 putative kinesin [Trypanosoma rangeli]
MPANSPKRSNPTSARPVSTPKRGEREFRRTHSSLSLITAQRSALDAAQAQGNAMKVYVRVRPFSERELSLSMPHHSTVRIDVDNPCFITLLDPQKDFRPRETFSFTRCFWSVLETNAGDSSKGRSAGEIHGSIDMFINSVTSARCNRYRAGVCINTTSMSVASARGRAAAEYSVPFEGAGSNAAIASSAAVVHPPYSSQEDVYNVVGRPVLENSLEGYNGCVFAYGQTGSGKTFSMFGYFPKSSDFTASVSQHGFANNNDEDEDEDEECDDTKLSIGVGSPTHFRHLSAPSSQKELFILPLGTHGNTERQVADTVDTTQLDPNELQGIIPRITSDLFKGLQGKRDTDPSHSYRVEVEYFEIYNEKVFDLFRPQKDADLRIRHNPVSGPYVEGLTSSVVNDAAEVAKVIRKGNKERRTAATKANDRSSRSHAIITLNITRLFLDRNDNTCKQQSKLNLVDLAGSERTGAVGAEGKQFLEGTKINLSLTTLGRVIDCLADLSQSKSLSVPVPYRDSNLTWLLMDSLGGNSKTSMLATISPHGVNFDEMRQTIRYASRAKQIVNQAVINEDPQVRQIRLLTAEVERLKKTIREAGLNEFSRDYVVELQRRNTFLEKRCQDQEKTVVELQAEIEERRPGMRMERSHTLSARRSRPAHLPETSTCRRCSNHEENGNALLPTTRLTDTKSDVEDIPQQLNGGGPQCGGPDTSSNMTHVEELNIRIQNLKREVSKQQTFILTQHKQLERYSLFCINVASNIMWNVMVQKEDEFTQRVARVIKDQSANLGKDLRSLQESHREEMEQTRRRHMEEMKELQKLSASRLKESIEKSNELYQQLIDKHVDKLNYVEERMKKNKEDYKSERKKLADENEAARASYNEQLQNTRAQHQQETKWLRDKMSSGASDCKRLEEAVKRLQEVHEREMTRRQEEADRHCQEKEQEITRLKQQIGNEAQRQANDTAEKDRQRRSLEREVNDLRRELLKAQAERTRMEHQHQTEIQSFAQEQEQIFNVSNGLLSDWDNRSSAIDASFAQLRTLVQGKDYLSFRSRLRDSTGERKDYTALLEAVEERKQRDTQRFREIVQQLKQTQEDSNASLQRFKEDVKSQLVSTSRPRGNNVGKNTCSSSNNIDAGDKKGSGSGGAKATVTAGSAAVAPKQGRLAVAQRGGSK